MNSLSNESDSTQHLVGSALPSMVQMSLVEEAGGGQASKVPTSKLRGRPPKPHPTKEGAGNSPPSSLDQEGADSDGYSTASEALGTFCCRRRQ